MDNTRPLRCMTVGLVAAASLFIGASLAVAGESAAKIPPPPRVDIEIDAVAPGAGISPQSLLQSVRSTFEANGKFVVVATAREREYLRATRHPALAARADDAYACEEGQTVGADSVVKVSITGEPNPKQLHLRLLSAKKGCLVASGSSAWDAQSPQRSLSEASTLLQSKLSPSGPRQVAQPAALTGAKGDCVTDPNLPPGRITITTEPFSTIYWNGRKLGQTPLARATLPAGCVTLVAKNEKLGLERQVKIKVKPGRDNLYKFGLE